MTSPYPIDGARQTYEDRTAQFLVCLRTAISRGFSPELFAGMTDDDVRKLAAYYIGEERENLTIFDPAFLEALYGPAATRKAHWLIELRMRRMDVVPALWQDLQSHVKITVPHSDE